MVTKRHSAKRHSAKRHYRGGNPAEVSHETEKPVDTEVVEEPAEIKEMTGGRRRRHHRTHKCSKKCKHAKRRGTKRRGGAGILATAALPFGLLGLNNFFGKKRSTKRHHGRRHHKRSFRKSRK